jgi:hypothetical protein
MIQRTRTMPHYRVYYVGRDGHFSGAENIECADDQAAIQTARQLVNGQDAELWQQSRFVGRLSHDDSIQPISRRSSASGTP